MRRRAATGAEKISKAARNPSVCVCMLVYYAFRSIVTFHATLPPKACFPRPRPCLAPRGQRHPAGRVRVA